MTTIRDVAELANVSISTVSRALSGNVPVNEETRQRVLYAVEKLNYKPNVFAKGLKGGKSNMIALLIPNISNPIYSVFARGVESAARKEGFNVILCNTDENEKIEAQYLQNLGKQWIDGVILATTVGKGEQLDALKKNNIPVVAVFRGNRFNIDQILVENKKGAYEMVKYLIGRGDRKIVMVNGRQNIDLFRERYEGYAQALAEEGIELDPSLVLELANEDYGSTFRAVSELLERGIRPDAIFASSDPIAYGVMNALFEHGLRIPEDVSVAGFDNLQESGYMRPALTTVSQPLHKMGVLAANCLIEQIMQTGTAAKAPKVYRMNTKLIIRNSTK